MYILSILVTNYTEVKVSLVEVTQDCGLYETYDDQVLAINTFAFKNIARCKRTTQYDKHINHGEGSEWVYWCFT